MSEKKSNKPTTASGINLKSYYGENQPGQYPYTSGIYSKMYQEKLWTMRQYAGFSSAKQSNERYQYLLNQGVDNQDLDLLRHDLENHIINDLQNMHIRGEL